MKLSVLITTYNQENYIRQAVDSVLMQAVDFDYELIIGEDCSTDRTRKIVLNYQEQHPEKIRILPSDPATAQRDRGRGVGGKTAFVNCLQACRGQYVALLDGDDYWISSHKLQKQVDFLDRQSGFAMSFHNATQFYEDESKPAKPLCPPDQKEVSTIEDLLLVNSIHSGSCMFRRGLFGDFPDWFFTARFGDWPLYILNAQHGKVGYINEVMSAYRVHPEGEWSSKDRVTQLVNSIEVFGHIDAYLGFKYKDRIRIVQAMNYYGLAEAYYRKNNFIEARTCLKKCLALGDFKHRRVLSLFLRLQAPTLYRCLKALRDFTRSALRPKESVVRDDAGWDASSYSDH